MISSFCNTGTCVDAQDQGDLIMLTDPDGNEVYYHYDEWDAFVKGVKAGEFDLDKLQAAANKIPQGENVG